MLQEASELERKQYERSKL